MMRWMKKLAAGVLAAGMTLVLLTACSGGGNGASGGITSPVQTSTPVTKAKAETITGKNVPSSKFQYIQYRVVDTSGIQELKYTVSGNEQSYIGADDKGVVYNFWWYDNQYYKVDNNAKTIVKIPDASRRTPEEQLLFCWTETNTQGLYSGSEVFNCYTVKYFGKDYIAEEVSDGGNPVWTYYYESENSTAPSYLLLKHSNYSDKPVMFKIEGWALGDDMNTVIPAKYRTGTEAIYDLKYYSSYEGYSDTQ